MISVPKLRGARAPALRRPWLRPVRCAAGLGRPSMGALALPLRLSPSSAVEACPFGHQKPATGRRWSECGQGGCNRWAGRRAVHGLCRACPHVRRSRPSTGGAVRQACVRGFAPLFAPGSRHAKPLLRKGFMALTRTQSGGGFGDMYQGPSGPPCRPAGRRSLRQGVRPRSAAGGRPGCAPPVHRGEQKRSSGAGSMAGWRRSRPRRSGIEADSP